VPGSRPAEEGLVPNASQPTTPPLAPPSSLARRRRKGERTAEQILDAAEALFAERGYAATTVRDVAEQVGLRTPSLYNHFPSKDALYAAVLERGIGPVLRLLASFADPESARPDSAELLREVMTVLARRPALPKLLLHETLTGGERLTPILRLWIEPAFRHAERMIDANPGGRRWDSEQIPLLVLALYHVVVGYFTAAPLYQALRGRDLLSPEALESQTAFLRRLVETLLPDELEPDPEPDR
jgi:TetR/AcrR family transcriptional regulator